MGMLDISARWVSSAESQVCMRCTKFSGSGGPLGGVQFASVVNDAPKSEPRVGQGKSGDGKASSELVASSVTTSCSVVVDDMTVTTLLQVVEVFRDVGESSSLESLESLDTLEINRCSSCHMSTIICNNSVGTGTVSVFATAPAAARSEVSMDRMHRNRCNSLLISTNISESSTVEGSGLPSDTDAAVTSVDMSETP